MHRPRPIPNSINGPRKRESQVVYALPFKTRDGKVGTLLNRSNRAEGKRQRPAVCDNKTWAVPKTGSG